MKLDDVVCLLNQHYQRATYGAVAGVVGGLARGLMSGRPRSHADSWIVAKSTSAKSGSRRGWPSGYAEKDIHPKCLSQIRSRPDDFIVDPDELRSWLNDQGWKQQFSKRFT